MKLLNELRFTVIDVGADVVFTVKDSRGNGLEATVDYGNAFKFAVALAKAATRARLLHEIGRTLVREALEAPYP